MHGLRKISQWGLLAFLSFPAYGQSLEIAGEGCSVSQDKLHYISVVTTNRESPNFIEKDLKAGGELFVAFNFAGATIDIVCCIEHLNIAAHAIGADGRLTVFLENDPLIRADVPRMDPGYDVYINKWVTDRAIRVLNQSNFSQSRLVIDDISAWGTCH